MSRVASNQALLLQASGALAWAAFFILAPFEVLLLGAIIWIPLFVWREIVRTKRYGFLMGALCRYSLITVVITLAALAPTKSDDKKVGPLPARTATLGQLASAGIVYPLRNSSNESVTILLPSILPTRREVMTAVSQQTQFKASIFRCGNGATILFGSSVGRIRVVEPADIASR